VYSIRRPRRSHLSCAPPRAHGFRTLAKISVSSRIPDARFTKPLYLRGKHATITTMILAIWAIRILEFLFFVGLIGSSIVVIISFVEDGKELFGKD
jgi:hypothetical protein